MIINSYNFGITYPDDSDVTTYLTTVGISNNSTVYFSGTAQETTGTAIWNAFKRFAYNYKAAGLWTLATDIFPMLGTTGTQMQRNLKSSTVYLEFVNSWTFRSSGALPNGVDTYGRFLIGGFSQAPNALFTNNDLSLAYYSRTDSLTTGQIEFGVRGNEGFEHDVLLSAYYGTDGGAESRLYDFTHRIVATVPDTLGLIRNSRISTTDHRIFKNGSQVGSTATFTNADGLPTGQSQYFGAFNNFGSATNNTSRECAFMMLGKGLTSSQAATDYEIIQQLQTDLKRQV